MNWIQIFDVLWLTSILVLLFLIWRSSERRLKHVTTLEKTMIEVAALDAESARKAVQANQELIAMLKAGKPDVL